jgi:cytochrome c553
MFSKIELKLAYGLAIWLLLVGVICYAAFPPETPDQPIRLLYTPAAGKVLFDHQTHQSVNGYAISCGDCHHTLAEDEYDQAQACVECHDPTEGDEEVPKLADAIHKQCGGCHEAFGAGPVEKDCSGCHVM